MRARTLTHPSSQVSPEQLERIVGVALWALLLGTLWFLGAQ